MKSSKLLFIILSSYLLFGCTKYVEKSSTNNTGGTGGTNGGSNNTGSSGTSETGPIVISYTSTSPCAPSTEKFTFTCTGSGVPSGATFEWYFGDGNSGSGATTTNTYFDGGYKTVLVKVKKDGQDVGQQTLAVRAFGQDVTPIASFSYTPATQVGTQATYDFQSNSYVSKGSPAYKWDFGDGGTASDIKVSHTFQQKTTEQNFTVKLTVTSDAGCSDTKSITITVPPAYNITGGFTATSTSPCAPSSEVFTFTGPTTNVPTGAIYTWDFADGSGTALGNPITKAYAYHNTYNVILNIIYNGKSIYTVAQPIHPFGIDATPIASFSAQNTSSTATTATYFFNNSSQANGGFSNVQWDWDFGDGKTLSTSNYTATKIYDRDPVADKTYTVTMKVTANSGCSATKTTTVIIPKQ